MRNTENVTLMLLVVATGVLSALVAASWVHTEPAYGSAASAKDGDYIMAVGA